MSQCTDIIKRGPKIESPERAEKYEGVGAIKDSVEGAKIDAAGRANNKKNKNEKNKGSGGGKKKANVE